MATKVTKNRKGATAPQKGTRNQEPHSIQETPDLGMEEPAVAADESNPIHDGQESKEVVDHVPTELSSADPAQGQIAGSIAEPQMSLVQRYSLLTIYTFGDCVRQQDESGVFDVLARNFADNGNLSFFLHKIGMSHLTAYAKGHDIVDYVRKTAHELFKAMKDIGKPIARW